MTANNEYGKALFLIAEEEECFDTMRDGVEAVYTLLRENPDYIKTLDTPAISVEEKIRMIDEAFASLNENLVNLLKILCEKRAVYSFAQIRSAFLELYDEKMGIVNVEAVSAVPLTEKQREAIRAKLEATTEKKIRLKSTVDPSILGGLKLRYLGIQIDGSVKTRLDSFAESLKNIVI